MDIEVLVSTMNQSDYHILKEMNIHTKAIVVNQCGRNSISKFVYEGNNIIWIDSNQKGLSKSRNLALSYATADICLIADDDLVYVNDYQKIVQDTFESTKADIIRFKVEGIEKPFKKYPAKKEKVGLIKSLKVSSVEMAFVRKSIENIRFDELIGAGTSYYLGEENAFLLHCLRNKLIMYYEPRVISRLHIGNSSWFEGLNQKYFISRGAAFAAMETSYTFFLILQFAIRKYRIYCHDISFLKAIQYMKQGSTEYRGKKRILGNGKILV